MQKKIKPNVWIIGGTSGYGLEISKFFIKKKYNVIVSGRKAEKEHEHLTKLNFLKYIQIDLGNERSISSICSTVNKIFQLDLIIITGAISNKESKKKLPLLEFEKNIYYKFIKINSIGPILIVKNILKNFDMKKKKIKVIFFSSKAAWSDLEGFGYYNTSKSLLHHLVLNLSAEINNNYPDFIFSSYILEPGEANTRMNKSSFIHPKKILPIIEFIENDNYERKTKFLDRDMNYLKFCYKINEMYN